MGNEDEEKPGNRKQATGVGSLTGDRQQATGNGHPTDLRKGHDIAERLLEFGVEVIRVAKALPKDVMGRHVATQLIRAATSGGANYEEARGAQSPDDFIHKLSIATKELRESIYWLKLVQRSASISTTTALSEANQLCAILAASIRTARNRQDS